METAAEKRYLLLKKRLETLHYVQPLGIESAALVERLLNDLVKTTEGFQQQKKQLEELKVAGAKNEHLQAPLKKEIQKLIQENNQLHLSMIQVKEECESKDNHWRTKIRMLESEKSDWNYLFQQKQAVEKKLEAEVLRLKSRGNENKDPNSLSQSMLEKVHESQQQIHEMREKVRQSESISLVMEEKIKHLEQQVMNRDQELMRMKSKFEVMSLNTDRLAHEYHLTEAENKCKRYLDQIDMLTQENQRLNDLKTPQQVATTTQSVVRSVQPQAPVQDDQKVRQLTKEISEKNFVIDTLHQKQDQLLDEIASQKNRIEGLTLQNEELLQKANKAELVVSAYQSDKLAFAKVVENLKSHQDNAESSFDQYKTKIKQLEQENQMLDDRFRHMEILQQQHQREKDLLTRNLQQLREDYEREKDMVVRLNEKLSKPVESVNSTIVENKYHTLLEDYQKLKCSTQDKDQELRFLQDTHQRLKYENERLQQKLQEYTAVSLDIKETDVQVRALENRNQLLIEDLHHIKLEKVDLQSQIKQQQDTIQRQKIENDKLTQKMNEFADHASSMQISLRRAHEREGEFNIIGQELERVRNNERKLIVENERLQTNIQKQEVFISNSNKNIENLTKAKEDLLKEISQLRGEISKTKLNDNDTKNVSLKLNEKLSSQQTAIDDLRELLQREQRRSAKLQQDLAEQRQQSLVSQSQLEEATTQVKQLKSLSESLERSREELVGRLQNKNSEKLDEEKIISQMKNLQTKLEEKIKHQEQELLTTRKALQQVDQERDEMQSSLDEKTEENVQLNRRMQKLNEELERQQSKMMDIQSRGDKGFETVATLEERLREYTFKIQMLSTELENMKYTVGVKEKTLGELTTDLQIMSRENQSLTSQLARSTQERELIQQQQGYQQQQELRAREQLRLTEMEMRDIQANYAEVCADNQRLQQTMQQLSYQHNELIGRLQEMEKEDDFLNQQMQSVQRKDEQYRNQIAHLERELIQSNKRCEEMDRQMREVARQNDQMAREFNAQRRVSQGYASQQDELQRQLMNFDHERKLQQDSILTLQREIQIKDTQFELERSKAHELENILIREREQQMRLSDEIEGLRQQNEHLLNELEKFNNRVNRNDFGGISRVSADPFQEQQELANEIMNLRRSANTETENSRLEQSAAWERLRQESEVFKKSINQTALSSNYLKMKMKNLQKEYQQAIPQNKY